MSGFTCASARISGLSRHALGRYLNVQAQPSFPVFLELVHLGGRLVQFLDAIAEPTELPSAAQVWARHLQHAKTYIDAPLAGQVHLALTMDAYRALPRHQPGWIARTLRISRDEEDRCLEVLLAAGLAERVGGHYEARAATVQFDLQRNESDIIARQRAWANRRLWEGDPLKRQVLTALVSRAEARKIERMVTAAAEEARRVSTTSKGAEELLFLAVAVNRYPPGGPSDDE